MAQFDSTTEQARLRAKTMTADVRAAGRDTVDAFTDVSNTMGDALDKSISERPYATLAIAAGLGFLLGAIWAR